MRLNFAKMNGAGNDVMIVEWPKDAAPISPELVRRFSDRRRGVGFDQLLLLTPGTSSKPAYRIFNADGGEVEQCGNGARCLAQFLAPRYGAEFTLESPAGEIQTRVLSAERVSVNLGEPNFDPQSLPFAARERRDRYELEVQGRTIVFGAVSMGNPHIVIEVDSVERAPVGILGPVLEKHPSFPRGVNVGFMQVDGDDAVSLRVFERGTGETLACGTGAAAAVAVGRIWGKLGPGVRVQLPGGALEVSWRGPGTALWQTGPTTLVYEGQIDI
jgi:diaminopimelate epimerase